MSLEKSEAVVLRTVEWSETSLIVTLFTREFGKVSAIAKGARRLKSPFESALDLLSLSSVVFLKKSGESLDLLIEAKLTRRFRSARVGLLPLYCGYYAAELINALTENHQPIPGLMESLCQTLEELDRNACPSQTILEFELQTLERLGHLPSWRQCVVCGEDIQNDRHTVAFSASGGGVVCQGCTPSQRNILRIRQQTLAILDSTTAPEARIASNPREPIPPGYRGEIRLVMENLVQCLSERRLRLLDYLEDLKR